MSGDQMPSGDARTLLERYDALVAAAFQAQADTDTVGQYVGMSVRLGKALEAAIRVVEDWEVDGGGKHAGKAVASLSEALSALRSGGAA